MEFEVIGPDVSLPGSEQLAPALFAILSVAALGGVVVAVVVRRVRAASGKGGPPIVVGLLSVATVAAAVMTVLSWPSGFTSPEFPPTGRLFPEEAFFHRPIDDLEVAAESDRWIESLGTDPLRAGFGGEPVDGVVFGVPFNPVDAGTPRTDVRMRGGAGRSYQGPYPIADPAYIESMPTYGFDNHYVAIDPGEGLMWELIGTSVWFGRWEADAGALWDLDSLEYGRHWTTASRLPLLPGALTYDEVADGRVRHTVWAGSTLISSDRHVWPALATDGLSDSPDAPPMGAWLRLRDDVDLSGLGPQARVIAEGLREHGLMLTDTSGQSFGLRGTPDRRWDRADLATISQLDPSHFEVVDHSGLMVADDSMAAVPRPADGAGS